MRRSNICGTSMNKRINRAVCVWVWVCPHQWVASHLSSVSVMVSSETCRIAHHLLFIFIIRANSPWTGIQLSTFYAWLTLPFLILNWKERNVFAGLPTSELLVCIPSRVRSSRTVQWKYVPCLIFASTATRNLLHECTLQFLLKCKMLIHWLLRMLPLQLGSYVIRIVHDIR